MIRFSGQALQETVTTSAGFTVTATENSIMMAAFEPRTTIIQLAAIEPHVMNLIDFLQSIGVKIDLGYDHTITIQGLAEAPTQATGTVIADYIESGTFIILGALAAKDTLTIKHARIQDLTLFLEKCEEAGVQLEKDIHNDTIIVRNSLDTLTPVHIQTNIYPGFPTDLQSPFALLLTQAEGTSRIHEVLFE